MATKPNPFKRFEFGSKGKETKAGVPGKKPVTKKPAAKKKC